MWYRSWGQVTLSHLSWQRGPLFRKARSRTLSTPGDGSGLTTSLAIGIATQRSLPQSSHNTWSFRMIEAERTQDQDTTDPS